MHRRKLAAILFPVYFLLYAVSPLTYAVHTTKTAEASLEPRPAVPDPQSLHTLLWELVVEKFAARSKASAHETGCTILIKKKRALVPEDDTTRLAPNTSIIPTSGHTSPARDLAAGSIDANAPRNLFAGFHLLYAGHAPPSI